MASFKKFFVACMAAVAEFNKVAWEKTDTLEVDAFKPGNLRGAKNSTLEEKLNIASTKVEKEEFNISSLNISTKIIPDKVEQKNENEKPQVKSKLVPQKKVAKEKKEKKYQNITDFSVDPVKQSNESGQQKQEQSFADKEIAKRTRYENLVKSKKQIKKQSQKERLKARKNKGERIEL